MEHEYLTHERCERMHCPICDGGLAECVNCGGIEGTLTTDCCGRKMTIKEQDCVYSGTLDYINGDWLIIEHVCKFCNEPVKEGQARYGITGDHYDCWDKQRTEDMNVIRKISPITADVLERLFKGRT